MRLRKILPLKFLPLKKKETYPKKIYIYIPKYISFTIENQKSTLTRSIREKETSKATAVSPKGRTPRGKEREYREEDSDEEGSEAG